MRRIGVDFDGTLAVILPEWKGPFYTGEPIAKMVEKVKAALAEGAVVTVFTARIIPHFEEVFDIEIAKDVVRAWCLKHIGVELDVTSSKAGFTEMWDDRAVQVIPDTGEFLHEAVLRLIEEEVVDARIEDSHESVWPLLALRNKVAALVKR